MGKPLWFAVLLITAAALITSQACHRQQKSLYFGAGPQGGTFIVYAEGIAAILQPQLVESPEIVVRPSGGSIANLDDIAKGEVDMGLAYAGDAFLRNTDNPESNIMAIASLYGAEAQLVVLADSLIRSPYDLAGKKKVAIGNPGSGAAVSAERYFRAIGIWDDIIPIHYGYSLAMEDLVNGRVHAAWQLVGAPSSSIQSSSELVSIRLLDLQKAARGNKFFQNYPFYTETVIPKGTYNGQDNDIMTFKDSTLWVASKKIDEFVVYRALQRIYSEKGLNAMHRLHPSARKISVDNGLVGIKIPFHPGAKRFWTEKGQIAR